MKKLILLFLLFYVQFIFSQNELKSYYVYFNHSSNVPKFETVEGNSYYVGNDEELKKFFGKYSIKGFYQALPEYPIEKILRVYVIETYNAEFMNDFFVNYYGLVESFEDISSDKIELQYYPNDYGLTNPNGSQGINIDRRDLDYINAQKAWDINTGQGVKIGISDARIKPDDPDFVNKITFLPDYPFSTTPYNPNNINSSHGTSVAAIAAGQGNNSYGSTGVCFDCEILATGYGWQTTSPSGGYNGQFKYLKSLADAGARVINMSWALYRNYVSVVEQDAINYLVNEMGVVLVAGAGNNSSNQTSSEFFCPPHSYFNSALNQFIPSYTGIQTAYPASYDGVISVSSVEHYFDASDQLAYCCQSPTHEIGLNIKDSFAININIDDVNNPIGLVFNGYQRYCNYNGSNYLTSPNGVVSTYTFNESVDILAPANKVYNHVKLAEENYIGYHEYGGTSSATPFVSGTAALMVGTYDCINPNEVDDILKLTAKDVVNLPINQNYKEYIGAGKLETGDAVEFVNEMKKTDGIAKIKNHIFNRFNFKLERINNKLEVENVTFKDNCIADFTVKNQIKLLPGTHLKPNNLGYTHLKIDDQIDITCSSTQRKSSYKEFYKNENIFENKLVVYPNPSNGRFIISGGSVKEGVQLKIIDVNGRIVYDNICTTNNLFEIDLSLLQSGIYILNVFTNNEKIHVQKLIKN